MQNFFDLQCSLRQKSYSWQAEQIRRQTAKRVSDADSPATDAADEGATDKVGAAGSREDDLRVKRFFSTSNQPK